MRVATARMAPGIEAWHALLNERSERTLPERILPYGLANMLSVTPTGWTLTEATREIRLRADGSE